MMLLKYKNSYIVCTYYIELFDLILLLLLIRTAIIALRLVWVMSRKKSKKKVVSNVIDSTEEKQTNPRTAKIVLFVFGVGPLLLMCLFLFSNGFFNSP